MARALLSHAAMTSLGVATLAAAILACTGCAEIRLRTTPEVLGERVLRQVRATEVTPAVTTFFAAEDRGTRLALSVVHTCARRSYREVERTVRYAHYDANARGTRALGVTGGAIAALGTALLALPATRARTDHAADLGAGVPITALGVGLAAAALVGVSRARERVEAVEVVHEDGGLVGSGVPCGTLDRAAAGEHVTAKVVGVEDAGFLEGKTDAKGELELNLLDIPAALVKAAPEPKQIALFTRAQPALMVSLAPYLRAAEEKAWQEADARGCAVPTSTWSCTLVARFITEHPESDHLPEAREALARGQAAISALHKRRAPGLARR